MTNLKELFKTQKRENRPAKMTDAELEERIKEEKKGQHAYMLLTLVAYAVGALLFLLQKASLAGVIAGMGLMVALVVSQAVIIQRFTLERRIRELTGKWTLPEATD